MVSQRLVSVANHGGEESRVQNTLLTLGSWASSSQQGPAQPRLERPRSESAQPDGLPPSDGAALWLSPQP